MKKLIIVLVAVVLGNSVAFAQEKQKSEKKQDKSPIKVEEKDDSTFMQIGDMKIVISEKEGDNVEVTIKTKDGTKVINTKKDRVEIDEDGLEIEGEDGEDYDYEKDSNISLKDDKEDELENVDTRFLMLDIGINGYLNSDNEFSTPPAYDDLELQYGKSINVHLHAVRQRLNLIKHHVNLQYGLSFEFNNYRFSDDVTLQPDADIVTPISTEESAKKSKLSDTYFYIPLMLNFESNPEQKNKSFRANVGGYGGVLIASHTKVKTHNGDKIKRRDDFNLSSFRYGVSAKIGYGWFNLYANYSLSNMFKDDQGPVATPFSVGIGIIGF